MPTRRRTDQAAGRAALDAWLAAPDTVDAATITTAVRFTLEELAARHPGNAVEVRVPPIGAVQCLPGVRHRRGTPPNIVETDAATWLALATGRLGWGIALGQGAVQAGGTRADLTTVLPLVDL
jgi:hypothetical protein